MVNILLISKIERAVFPIRELRKMNTVFIEKSQWFGPRSVNVCETARGFPTMMKSLTCGSSFYFSFIMMYARVL